jgi:hypothetical protein
VDEIISCPSPSPTHTITLDTTTFATVIYWTTQLVRAARALGVSRDIPDIRRSLYHGTGADVVKWLANSRCGVHLVICCAGKLSPVRIWLKSRR